MKILFSGYHNPNFITITEYCENAIVDLGYECFSFDDREFLLPGRLRDRFSFLENWDLNRLNTNLLSMAQKIKPDICIVTGGHRILPSTIEKLKKEKIKTILWTIDPPQDFVPIKKVAPLYDFVFCGGTEAIDLLNDLKLKNLEWLPFACDTNIHYRRNLNTDERSKYNNDIVFIGSYYPNRSEIFESIADYDFGIWGPGWEKLEKTSPLKKCVRKAGSVEPDEWLKALSGAKIAIAIHYQDGQILCNQASPKVYEAMACSCMLMVDKQRDVQQLFKNGEEIVVFEDSDDLRRKLDFYLNSIERDVISRKGHDVVVKKHTYKQRIKRMIDYVK